MGFAISYDDLSDPDVGQANFVSLWPQLASMHHPESSSDISKPLLGNPSLEKEINDGESNALWKHEDSFSLFFSD